MKNYSYNCGKPIKTFIVPTHSQVVFLFEKLKKSGHIFRVDFRKRTNGEKRTMICRFGVKKYLKGGKRAYNPIDKELFVVFDCNKQAYRSFGVEDLIAVKHGTTAYLFGAPVPPGTYPADILERKGVRTLPAFGSPLNAEQLAVNG